MEAPATLSKKGLELKDIGEVTLYYGHYWEATGMGKNMPVFITSCCSTFLHFSKLLICPAGNRFSLRNTEHAS